MKRILSVFLVLSLCCCMAFPVNATENVTSTVFDVLAYGYPNGGDSYIVWLNDGGQVSFSVPRSTYLYVEFLIRTDAVNLSVTSDGYYDYPLIVTPVYLPGGSANIYRVYGNLDGGQYSELTFTFNFTSGSNVTFDAVYAGTLNLNHFDEDCYCDISSHTYQGSIHYVSSDDINYRSFRGAVEYELGYLDLDLRCAPWRKYDYIDYVLKVDCGSINSISAFLDDQNIPFTVSPFDNDSLVVNGYVLSIRLDVRGLDRINGNFPTVHITCNVANDELNYVEVLSCSGIVVQTNVSPDIYLLRSIWISLRSGFDGVVIWIQTSMNALTGHFQTLGNWLSGFTAEIVSAIRGDTAPGDSFQEDVSQKDSELKDMAAVMDSVSKPDINNISVEVNDYVDPNILASSMSGISTVAASPIFSDVLLMAIILATAGYVLYGKR